MEDINHDYFNSLLENDLGFYNIEIEEQMYSIPVKVILEYITAKENDYLFLSFIPPISDISFIHFRYAVLKYFDENLSDQSSLFGDTVVSRLDEIRNDYAIKNVGTVYKNNDPNLKLIKVHPSLKDKILDGMPTHYDDLFKALYIYIKMCKILTYDEKFFVYNQQGDAASYHEDISHIESITPENNEVVCYEFAAIFEALLKEQNISCEIVKGSGNLDAYGDGHAYVKFKYYGSIIKADSTTDIFLGDIFRAKLNLNLCGFRVSEGNCQIYNCIQMVYDDINENKKNTDYAKALKEYKSMLTEKQVVSAKDKIDSFVDIINSTGLKGIDFIANMKYLASNFFENMYNICVMSFSTIRYNSENGATPLIVFVTFEGDMGYQYYTCLPNQKLVRTSAEELQSKFELQELSYIRESDRGSIYGIKY